MRVSSRDEERRRKLVACYDLRKRKRREHILYTKVP